MAKRPPRSKSRLNARAIGSAVQMMTFEILTIIVLVNLGLTIKLWRRAARGPEKLKRKFRNRLWSVPITPKHEPPPPLEKGNAAELQFFSDFEDFANVVNAWQERYYYPWRLQELPKSGGRTYAVFHNEARLGEIK